VKRKFAGPVEIGVGSGIYVGAGGITGISMEEEGGSVEEEGASASDGAVEGASDLLPLAFLGPLKVTIGSSRFQKFFLMYAKLMAGLKLSKVRKSERTPRALHKAVIKVGKPSLDESCWALSVI